MHVTFEKSANILVLIYVSNYSSEYVLERGRLYLHVSFAHDI